jgi:hypothetical protein
VRTSQVLINAVTGQVDCWALLGEEFFAGVVEALLLAVESFERAEGAGDLAD